MAAALALSTPAFACSFVGPQDYLTEASDDQTEPSHPEIGEVSIGRGRAPRGFLLTASSSCDDIGSINIPLMSADDVTPSENLGWRVETDGDLPDGLVVPEGPMFYFSPNEISWVWLDDATHKQEPFDFTATIFAIDEAGNESEPTLIDLVDRGRGNGCSTAPGGTTGFLAIVAAFLLARTRRRAVNIRLA